MVRGRGRDARRGKSRHRDVYHQCWPSRRSAAEEASTLDRSKTRRRRSRAPRRASGSSLDRGRGEAAAGPLAPPARAAAAARARRARPAQRPGVFADPSVGPLLAFGTRIATKIVHHSRRASWRHTHLAVSDRSRLAYARVLACDRPTHALALLERALN